MNLTDIEAIASAVKRTAEIAGPVASVILKERWGEAGGVFEIKYTSGRRAISDARDKGNISIGHYPKD
jgi:hypothetical protein